MMGETLGFSITGIVNKKANITGDSYVHCYLPKCKVCILEVSQICWKYFLLHKTFAKLIFEYSKIIVFYTKSAPLHWNQTCYMVMHHPYFSPIKETSVQKAWLHFWWNSSKPWLRFKLYYCSTSVIKEHIGNY